MSTLGPSNGILSQQSYPRPNPVNLELKNPLKDNKFNGSDYSNDLDDLDDLDLFDDEEFSKPTKKSPARVTSQPKQVTRKPTHDIDSFIDFDDFKPGIKAKTTPKKRK
jgi:hypothetical protein